MDEPDVTFQLAGPAELQEYRRTQHECSRRRVIIVRPQGSHTCQLSAALFVVKVFHIRRVVVIGHDHRAAPVLPRDNYQEIAFALLPFLVRAPAAHPVEFEIGLPPEGKVSGHCLPLHTVLRYRFPVKLEKPVPEDFQITMALLPD